MENNNDEGTTLWSEMWKTLVSPDLTTELIAVSTCKTLANGEALFRQGDIGTDIYGVKKGNIQLVGNMHDGNEAIVGIFTPCSWFGELAIFDRLPRLVNAYSVGATEVYVVSSARLHEVLQRNPIWYRDFAQVLAHKLRVALLFINNNALPIQTRIAMRILDIAQIHGKQSLEGIKLEIRLTQEDLAKMLLLRRQTINKVLRKFASENLIQLGRGHITITNLALLEASTRDINAMQ